MNTKHFFTYQKTQLGTKSTDAASFAELVNLTQNKYENIDRSELRFSLNREAPLVLAQVEVKRNDEQLAEEIKDHLSEHFHNCVYAAWDYENEVVTTLWESDAISEDLENLYSTLEDDCKYDIVDVCNTSFAWFNVPCDPHVHYSLRWFKDNLSTRNEVDYRSRMLSTVDISDNKLAHTSLTNLVDSIWGMSDVLADHQERFCPAGSFQSSLQEVNLMQHSGMVGLAIMFPEHINELKLNIMEDFPECIMAAEGRTMPVLYLLFPLAEYDPTLTLAENHAESHAWYKDRIQSEYSKSQSDVSRQGEKITDTFMIPYDPFARVRFSKDSVAV